jgi:hypothetical protein
MGKGFTPMKASFFNLHDIVYYMGKLYRVMGWGLSGPHQGKMLLRLCGWEQCYGNWGWESYNRPFPTTAWVGHGNPFVYHA